MKGIISFYAQGFRSMTLGRRLWTIILVKLVVLFAVFKMFFFPDMFKEHFATDAERGGHVLHTLSGGVQAPTLDGVSFKDTPQPPMSGSQEQGG
ncbi:MAG: DUF4492 domain-containing protein [Deltaproteobacteria bacterium]|nr:DUF4492 domain-containing protein [Deltaproteobacteria bacterium]